LVCLKVIISRPIVITIVKEKTSWINIPVCLQSEIDYSLSYFLTLILIWELVIKPSQKVRKMDCFKYS
ncbi:hypothetical protein, partial [Streptococcus agalactiae]